MTGTATWAARRCHEGMTRLLTGATAAALALLAIAVPAGAANPDPPAASTSAPDAVTLDAATLKGSVTPNGAATTYRFEYGTSDSYGLGTSERDAGSGTDPVAVSVPVAGLTSDTTYHVRLVATNAAGVTRTTDRTFRTTAPTRAAGVSTSSATTVRADSAVLRGALDPRGQSTTYRFEYGTTKKYGSLTPEVTASWAGSKSVRAAISGLAPYTTYHYRLVATGPAGTSRGGNRSLRTLRAPTGITLTATPGTVDWGAKVTIAGQVLGTGVGGTSLSVQRTDFPFTRGFWVPRNFSAGRDARFSTTIGPLWETTRLQLATRTTTVARSQVLTVGVRVRVGVRRQPAGRRAVVLTGVIRPAVPQAARVSVQRRTLAGVWVPVARTSVAPLAGNRSRYRVRTPRTRRTSQVRVVVLPNDGGAHAAGMSRALSVRGSARAR